MNKARIFLDDMADVDSVKTMGEEIIINIYGGKPNNTLSSLR